MKESRELNIKPKMQSRSLDGDINVGVLLNK